MKRRNAESGKLRRPVKRTKIVEGMYGNSLLYLKFVMVWATVVMADYMLEFRFEFLWPFWMMMRSVYDSFKYQGLAFSVFFICIALTSDMICYFLIPLQYIFFAASTYVWVQYVWYTFADKGICLPTVALCCLLVYVEGTLRVERDGDIEFNRPLASHCVGYPVVTLGFGVKSYVGHRLRLRRARAVRRQNDSLFRLIHEALPPSALEQYKEPELVETSTVTPPNVTSHTHTSAPTHTATDARHMNGSLKKRSNGVVHVAHKLDKVEKPPAPQPPQPSNKTSLHTHVHTHTLSNGHAHHEDAHDTKGSAKTLKCEKKEAITLKEERRKNKNKDKENSDSHKNTEQVKEIFKEVESTKESVKINKDSNSNRDCKERERDREREREIREREREMREREREREREVREARECLEELKRIKAELAAAKSSEADARRALDVATASERQQRMDHLQLKQAHVALQHKVSAWRTNERATLERRLGEERRARTQAENLLRARTQHNGECDNEWCKNRRNAQDSDITALRRELQRARETATHAQRDLSQATQQVRALEARKEENNSPSPRLANVLTSLQEKATHLERSLSAETRVKLDLLSALGEAKRRIQIQEGIISRQEKEIEELKAQMLAVMPTEYVNSVNSSVSKMRLSEGSHLDPNASVYTPKQLCSDA